MYAIQDMQSQIKQLVYPGFVQHTEKRWLKQIPKYLNGIQLRLKKLENAPLKDQERMKQLAPYWDQYINWVSEMDLIREQNKILREYHWMLQEMRISLFCQELGSSVKVSIQRLDDIVRDIKDSLKLK